MKPTFKLVLAGALCAMPVVAVACSCAPPPAPKIALEKSAAVFVGRVTSVEKSDSSNKYQFSVSKQWKGVEGNTVSIESAENSAACGINFDENRDYLVYAFKNEGENQLQTNLCSRTKRVTDAATDLAELGAPIAPAQNAAAKPMTVAPLVVEKNGVVQINTGAPSGDSTQPLTLLNQALQNHAAAQTIRLNWEFSQPLHTFPPTIRSGYATALYDRADSTLTLYSRYNDAARSYVKHVLYSGVTDETLQQLAGEPRSDDAQDNFASFDNLPQVGASATDLGSKTWKRLVFNLK